MKNTKTNVGQAGRRDDSVRSDCYVQVMPTNRGGIRLELKSKVDALYGDSIRTLVNNVIGYFGILHAEVTIHDQGAVPFVLAARLETAIKRALPELKSQYLLKSSLQKNKPIRDRMRRTRLYLPGNEPRYFLNAGLHAPDGIILDLEDSVSPAEKDAARIMVRNALRTIDFGGAERMVRINSGKMGLEDLREIIPQGVDVVLIPKCESPADISLVARAISHIRKEGNIRDNVYLLPIIETAGGVVNANAIATASEEICAIAIGLEDYCADIGVERTREGKESAYARAVVVNAACAAGIQPLDSVFSDVADMIALQLHAAESKSLGFKGMGCIHPRQISVIHAAYAPKEKDIAKAIRIVLAYEDAKKSGSGVAVVDNKMIDMPVVIRALQTVAEAEDLGLLSGNWRESTAVQMTTREYRKEENYAE